MAIDRATLGRRLKEARERLGVSQEIAAQELGIPRTGIANIESGTRSVTSLELHKLAKLYRRDMADFVADEMPENDDPLVVLYRVDPQVQDDPSITVHVQACLQVCREGTGLEKMLGLDPRGGPPAYNLPTPRSVGEAAAQGTQVAQQERQRLGLGDAAIADLADLLNAQGLWASSADFPDWLSGVFLDHRSTGMVVIVNRNHGAYRKRFSYAHEYAHALLDRGLAGTVTSKSTSSEPIEKRANAFAAAFLMPLAGVHNFVQNLNKGQPSRVEQTIFDVATEGRIDAQLRPQPGSQELGYQDVIRLAEWFKVSYQAAVYRLRSLNLVSQKQCDDLIQHDALAIELRKELQLQEPCENDRELISQVVRLVIEARRRDEISRGRVLELGKTLGVSGRKLLDWAEAAKDN